MKLAMAQMKMSKNTDDNFQKSYDMMERAAGSDLLFFPEIQSSPFLPQYHAAELPAKVGAAREDFCLSPDDARLTRFQELAKKYQLAVSPNFYLHQEDGDFDTSLFIDRQGKLLGQSTMVHVVSAPLFYEKEYYTPSRDGFHVYETDFGKIAIVICFDRHLPESIRTCTLMGAELIIIPTANLKSEPMELFEQEIRVQAYHNGVFVAMCNRVGKEGGVEFAGESLVAAPDGTVLLKANDQEELLTCELDLSQSGRQQQALPYLRLRRPEMYR